MSTSAESSLGNNSFVDPNLSLRQLSASTEVAAGSGADTEESAQLLPLPSQSPPVATPQNVAAQASDRAQKHPDGFVGRLCKGVARVVGTGLFMAGMFLMCGGTVAAGIVGGTVGAMFGGPIVGAMSAAVLVHAAGAAIAKIGTCLMSVGGESKEEVKGANEMISDMSGWPVKLARAAIRWFMDDDENSEPAPSSEGSERKA